MALAGVAAVAGIGWREGVGRLLATSAACPVTDVILDDVEAELDHVAPPELQITTELVWEPPWTTDHMSAGAKAFMGW